MFKKIVSLMVAAMMISSCAAIGASAAETSESQAAADVAATEVAANDSSASVGASTSSETTGTDGKVTFKVPDNWKSGQQIYAHIWMANDDGSVSWSSWKSKAEKCTDNGDGTWSYDLSKLPGSLDSSKGAAYCVIFVDAIGNQTYNLTMSADCAGDTVTASGETCENPEDSEKTALVARWQNHSDCGPEKKITSTGHVIGETLPTGSTNETLLATYLKAYYADTTKTGAVPDLMSTLGVKGPAVYKELAKMFDKSIANAKDDSAKSDLQTEKEKCLAASKTLLGISDEEAKKAEESAASSATGDSSSSSGSGSGSNSGSDSGSGSSSSGSSSTGSSTTKTGQDSTILFVLGGMLVAAAGVMFVTRRKKN